MAKTPSLGFDIGSGMLKIVRADAQGIRRQVAASVPDNLVQEGHIVSFDAMGDFIRDTARAAHLHGGPCALVLPAGLSFVRRLHIPAMTTDQLNYNLPYEFRDFLSMPKDKYFYDYAVNALVRDESGAPAELDLTAAAIPKEVIAQYVSMFRRAGFRLTTAIPVECAFSNLLRFRAAARPEEADREACILDLGHSATRVLLYTGSRFETTRTIERGGFTADQAIAEALSIDEHIARTYKETNHNGAQALPDVTEICSSVSVEIMKAVNFYRFNNRDSELSDAYLCGGGSALPPFVDAISAALNLTIHSIDVLLPPVLSDAENTALCAAAAGAALQ